MKIAHRPTKCMVCGASGTGKTTFALRYLAGTHHTRVLIYDWQDEFALRLGVEARPMELSALGDSMDSFRLTIVSPSLTECRAEAGLEYIAVFARQYARMLPEGETVLLVVDELHRLQGTAAGSVCETFVDALEFGRRDGLDLLLCCQAPNLLNNRIRNQLTECVSFRHVDARAIQWLEPLGFDADELRALPRGAYIYANIETGMQRIGEVFPAQSARV